MKRSLTIRALAVVGTMAALSTTAQAAVMSCAQNQNPLSNSSFSHAVDKLCGISGNDAGAQGYFASNPTVFGLDGWTLAYKVDPGIDGDGEIVLNPGHPGVGSNGGNWSVDTFNGYLDVVVALKAGNGFDLYKVDTDFLSGEWTTSKGLSHFSIWYTGDQMSQVPLPASGLLLLGGLFGLRTLRKGG